MCVVGCVCVCVCMPLHPFSSITLRATFKSCCCFVFFTVFSYCCTQFNPLLHENNTHNIRKRERAHTPSQNNNTTTTTQAKRLNHLKTNPLATRSQQPLEGTFSFHLRLFVFCFILYQPCRHTPSTPFGVAADADAAATAAAALPPLPSDGAVLSGWLANHAVSDTQPHRKATNGQRFCCSAKGAERGVFGAAFCTSSQPAGLLFCFVRLSPVFPHTTKNSKNETKPKTRSHSRILYTLGRTHARTPKHG